MSYDKFGQQFLTEDELVNLIHINPELDIANVLLENPELFNHANAELYTHFPTIQKYKEPRCSVVEFDFINQSNWHMPATWHDFDIVEYLLNKCETDEQVNRVATELTLYDERKLLPLLQFLAYMIDTFRKNNVVWGVGRGSSVASYVLFLMGVHKTDSMLYDLDVTEFLR